MRSHLSPLLLLVLTLPLFCTAQHGKLQDFIIEDIIENAMSNSEEELDPNDLYEQLFALHQQPININQAEISDLEKFPFLNDAQIENLLEARTQYGDMLSKYELLYVDGFAQTDVRKLAHFVYFAKQVPQNKLSLKQIGRYGRSELISRFQRGLEKRKGYFTPEDKSRSHYLGDANRLYMRYQFKLGQKLQAGITAEKDPGEEFFSGSQKNGFDYYSAFVQLKDVGKLETLILGDYQAQFGQGLCAWTGFSMNKSNYATNIRKKEANLRRYSSTDENHFFRGIATNYKLGAFHLNHFISSKTIDASVSDHEILSLPSSGYHRTATEMQKKNAAHIHTIGSSANYYHRAFQLGINAIHYWFDKPLAQAQKAYEYYKLQGQSNTVLSTDYYIRMQKHRFFGELALNAAGGLAQLHGANLHVNKNISFAVLYRNYAKEFNNQFANAFRENTRVENERGLYTGIIVYPAAKWTITAYADAYRFSWPRYNSHAPAQGQEYHVQSDYNANRNLQLYLRLKLDYKEENVTGENYGLKELHERTRETLRLHASYRINAHANIKNRIEFCRYKKAGLHEIGYMLYQDINYNFEAPALQIRFRMALFNNSYNTRIYAYENDVLYAFSVPAYFGKGYRSYLLLKHTPYKHISYWLRFSVYQFQKTDQIGSGLDVIDGNLKSEIKLQVRMKF